MNQLQRNHTLDSTQQNDLLAIRMASVNPILDPWIYILLRKTVVLTLMEKIKCLFCKMGGRGRRGDGHFHCVDGYLSSSIISRDSPSLVSRGLRDRLSLSPSVLYLSEGNMGSLGSFQAGSQGGSSPLAAQTLQSSQEVFRPQRGLSQGHLEGKMPCTVLNEPLMCPKDPALQVTLTDETANKQEKCI